MVMDLCRRVACLYTFLAEHVDLCNSKLPRVGVHVLVCFGPNMAV